MAAFGSISSFGLLGLVTIKSPRSLNSRNNSGRVVIFTYAQGHVRSRSATASRVQGATRNKSTMFM